MVGEDDLGSRYADELRASGVEAFLSRSDAETGVYCALIRPDGGKTLLVSPGAALDLCLEPPREALFQKDATLYLESFLLRDRPFFMECLRRARSAGMEITIDLSNREVASANREFILAMLPDYCDVLFANEDEFIVLTELPLREGLELLASSSMEIVVKRAELGAVWASKGRIVEQSRPRDEARRRHRGGRCLRGRLPLRPLPGISPERCLRLGEPRRRRSAWSAGVRRGP